MDGRLTWRKGELSQGQFILQLASGLGRPQLQLMRNSSLLQLLSNPRTVSHSTVAWNLFIFNQCCPYLSLCLFLLLSLCLSASSSSCTTWRQLCRLVLPLLARRATQSACRWNIYELLCPLARDQAWTGRAGSGRLTEINVDPLGSGKDGARDVAGNEVRVRGKWKSWN